MQHILVATDDQAASKAIVRSFSSQAELSVVRQPDDLKPALAKRPYDVIFADLSWIDRSPERSFDTIRTALRSLWAMVPNLEIIVLTAQENIREAVKSVRAGADNYLTYPVTAEEAAYVLESLRESRMMQTELEYLRSADNSPTLIPLQQVKSPVMQAVFDKVRRVAQANTTVLLTGETGTGKGVLAKLIHAQSNRASGPFMGVHCGAIPETLVESELFGHEKGAFTGANKRKAGRFEVAAKGTIFLDEIGTISQSTQVRLLQVLQDKVFQRVGGVVDIPMEARIVAASNVDLEELVRKGEFRADLLFRLNVFPIEVPALRDRREDIPLLAEMFLQRLRQQHMKKIEGIHPDVVAAFKSYPWPGNIRELENLMERAYILETTHMLSPDNFPPDLFVGGAPLANVSLDLSLPLSEVRNQAKEHAQRRYIEELIAECRGKVNLTAERAGITTRQLRKLLSRYGIDKSRYKPAKSGIRSADL
ncbi:sigma-54 dependent transcriptional regulator [Desulfovibrio mangrovi]|uniref:sigma-54-dependent transcriptional regulator n=1 Tax=Desulfovibrio mangrovi TaxID=2976983 RepID=UPI0022466CD8|nr:sigma-54 dependent transcriptional regulator [Desulfovibrio mangrovi]UZP67071.1 sigma-54 dependent transcriptional regulator [Desulfovibrio mangrovi]